MSDAREMSLSRGLVALVDAADYEWLSQWKWSAVRCSGRFYACRVKTVSGKQTMLLMHRVLLDAPKGLVVDHINGDTVDNRRGNIRLCTQKDNAQNVRRHKDKVSKGPKGVELRPGRNRWVATHRGVYIGSFLTEQDASAAYDAAALAYSPEFCRPNNLGGTQCPAL